MDERRIERKVREFMSPKVVTLRPEDSIQEAAWLLAKSSMVALPVVSGDGSIVGLLTEDDLLFRLRKRRHSCCLLYTSDAADE